MQDTTKQTCWMRLVIVATAVVLISLQIAVLVLVAQLHGRAVKDTQVVDGGQSTITVTKDEFGTTSDGQKVYRYTLANRNKMQVQVITRGATITSVKVPCILGHIRDVLLGFDNLAGYEANPKPYFGAVVGRVAGRIANSQFYVDGVLYRLNANNGPHHLHGGIKGWDKAVWKAVQTSNGVVISHVSPDGDEHYPGEVHVNVTYTLTEDSQLIIVFTASNKGKATPINLTSHGYFNLGGEGMGNISDHSVTIYADQYLPVTDQLLPTGEIVDVNSTVFDLRKPTRLGDVLPALNGNGYDHSFCLRGPTGRKLTARVRHLVSGRTLDVYTDQPALQFYTGNFLDFGPVGKSGHSYPKQSALCLETQNYPNAINQPNFPDSVLREGSTYTHNVWYKFSATQ